MFFLNKSQFINKIALKYLKSDKLRLSVLKTGFFIMILGVFFLHSGGVFPKFYQSSIIFDVLGFVCLSVAVFFKIKFSSKNLFINLGVFFLFGILILVFFLFGTVTFSFFDSIINVLLHKNIAYYLGIGFETVGFFVLFFGVLLLIFNVYSTISIFGVFLGVSTMIVVLSVLGGMEGEQTRQILKFSPHIIITQKDGKDIKNYKEIFNTIKVYLNKIKDKYVISPYLEEELLLKSVDFDATQGILLRGIDPDSPTFNLEQYMLSGTLENIKHPERLKWTDLSEIFAVTAGTSTSLKFLPKFPSDLPGIILSGEQAKTLGVSLGSKVDAISPEGVLSPTGMIPKVIRFRVAGVYVTKYYKYDLKYAFTAIPMVQGFSNKQDIISGWEIRIKNESKIDSTAKYLQKILGNKYEVNTWKTRNKALFNAMKLEKFVMFIILIVIILVAAFSITANLIMVVMDKRSEIAILKAMGSTDSDIMKIFIMQGIFIGLTGLFTGVVFGLSICLFLSKVGLRMSENVFTFAQIPVSVNVIDVSVVVISTFIIALIATLYPARKATKVSPVESLSVNE